MIWAQGWLNSSGFWRSCASGKNREGEGSNQLLVAATEVFRCFEARGISGCLIGGLAVYRRGEPRLTRDVVFTVLAGLGSKERIIDACLEPLACRISDARDFALRHRVLFLRAANGVPIDIALGATSFEIESVQRSTTFEFESGYALRTCSAEDLIVHKCFAARAQDIADLRGIVVRQFGKHDLSRIRTWLKVFSDTLENPNLPQPFEEALRLAASAAEGTKPR